MGKKSHIGRSSGHKSKDSADSSSKTGGSGSGNGKPTHFLCFPIASTETVPQISSSLKYWMDITTRPKWKAPYSKKTRPPEDLPESNVDVDVDAPSKDEVTPNTQRPTTETLAERLKILPPVVTRFAGTWHLTLGVMDLGKEGQMQKALDVLHSLDLPGLLRDAERGPPAGLKSARRWRDDTVGSNDRPEAEIPPLSNSEVTPQTTENVPSTGPPTPLTINLSGLGGFPSLNKARVLWARPREQPSFSSDVTAKDRLYNFSLHLIQPFRDAGLITETRGLALHATVSNMRYTKNRGRTPGWKVDRVDAGLIGQVWNGCRGDVGIAEGRGIGEKGGEGGEDGRSGVEDGKEEEDADEQYDDRDKDIGNGDEEFVWLKNVQLDRVAICKLGSTSHEDPIWREWYPPVEGGERLIFGE